MNRIPSNTGTVLVHVPDTVRLETIAENLKSAGFEPDLSVRTTAPSSQNRNGDNHVHGNEAALLPFNGVLSGSVTAVHVFCAESGQLASFRNTESIDPARHPTLEDVERGHIIETLRMTRWHCKNTAKLLGIDRSTLYRKMKRYGISRETDSP